MSTLTHSFSKMIEHSNRKGRKKTNTGRGFVNKLINSLPIELHLPSYKYCGPGTKLEERLARGDKGVNKLDEACKIHDIAYQTHKDLTARHQADLNLAEAAWQRVKSSDASLGEKSAAWFVTNAMKAKQKFGMGLRKKKLRGRKQKLGMGVRKPTRKSTLNGVINVARKTLRSTKPTSLLPAVKIAQAAIKNHQVSPLRSNRIIPIPKMGGVLPLVPIFAGLSAIGSLIGGATGIAKAVNEAKQARDTLAEQQRHNLQLEKQSIGHGLFIQPYKRGCGVYVPAVKKKTTRR